jgi:hypothetical protein
MSHGEPDSALEISIVSKKYDSWLSCVMHTTEPALMTVRSCHPFSSLEFPRRVIDYRTHR